MMQWEMREWEARVKTYPRWRRRLLKYWLMLELAWFTVAHVVETVCLSVVLTVTDAIDYWMYGGRR